MRHRKGLQEGFDITKLVGVLAVALLVGATYASWKDNRIEDGPDPYGKLFSSVALPMSGGVEDGCDTQVCLQACWADLGSSSPCTVANAACITTPDGEPACACAWWCPVLGGRQTTPKSPACEVRDASVEDGR